MMIDNSINTGKSSRRSRSNKKGVTFSQEEPIEFPPYVAELSKEERKTLWWTSKELNQIKCSANELIDMMKQKGVDTTFLEKKGFCGRGLENTDKKYLNRRHYVSGLLQCKCFNHTVKLYLTFLHF